MNAPVIEVKALKTQFDDLIVHDGVEFTIHAREIVAIVGGSGTGKTTLLRDLLSLEHPASGEIRLFGHSIFDLDESIQKNLYQRVGVMFQHGALFGALTIAENVAFPLELLTDLSASERAELARLKIALVGLPDDAADKYPAQLSGGMIKRAGVARAIALDPELLFLDEPTAGLDPNGAADFDELLLHLRETLGLTVVMITHDLDTLWRTTDRVLFLGERKVLCMDTMKVLAASKHPLIKNYFSGPRGRLAATANEDV